MLRSNLGGEERHRRGRHLSIAVTWTGLWRYFISALFPRVTLGVPVPSLTHWDSSELNQKISAARWVTGHFLRNSLGVKALIGEAEDQDFWFLLAREGLNQLFLFPERISSQARQRPACGEAVLSLLNPAAETAPLSKWEWKWGKW